MTPDNVFKKLPFPDKPITALKRPGEPSFCIMDNFEALRLAIDGLFKLKLKSLRVAASISNN